MVIKRTWGKSTSLPKFIESKSSYEIEHGKRQPVFAVQTHDRWAFIQANTMAEALMVFEQHYRVGENDVPDVVLMLLDEIWEPVLETFKRVVDKFWRAGDFVPGHAKFKH